MPSFNVPVTPNIDIPFLMLPATILLSIELSTALTDTLDKPSYPASAVIFWLEVVGVALLICKLGCTSTFTLSLFVIS